MERKSELLLQKISEGNPLQAQYINRMRNKEALKIDKTKLSVLCEFWEHRGMQITNMAEAYLEFVFAAMAEQVYFKKNHQYKNRAYRDICLDNYGNPDYMERYLAALAISDCLWENHLLIDQWYQKRIQKIDDCRVFAEIGCGSGVNLLSVLRRFRGVHCTVVDLSEKAIEICRDFLVWADRRGMIEYGSYEMICEDAFKWRSKNIPDIFSMFEVLEHVPDPEKLLEHIFEITDEHTVIFVSTVINSPMPDHIYLFRNQEEVKNMVENAGFHVVDCCCAPANGLSLEEATRSEAPITIALELRKGRKNV